MSKKINVRVSEIKAAILFASEDESRFVLNGVRFESRKDKPALLVATDGRRLCAIETEAEQDEGAEPFEMTVATATLKALCAFAKQFGKVLDELVTIDYHPSERIVVEFAGGKCAVDYEKDALIQGTYPDWRKTVPDQKTPKEQVSMLAINAELLSGFAKASKAMACESGIYCNLITESSVIEVRISNKPNFYGLIMPMKPESAPIWQPEFLGIEQAKAA